MRYAVFDNGEFKGLFESRDGVTDRIYRVGEQTYWLLKDLKEFDVFTSSPEALTAAAWGGEGLPPVGCVCEVYDDHPHSHYANHAGKQVRIIAHSSTPDDSASPTAVYEVVGDDGGLEYHALIAPRFRPIRTAEQLAAEAREATIAEMLERFTLGDHDGVPWWDLFAQMYDAGYRKSNA